MSLGDATLAFVLHCSSFARKFTRRKMYVYKIVSNSQAENLAERFLFILKELLLCI